MEQTRPQFLPQFSEFNPGTQNAPLSRERRGVTLRENQRLTLGELRSLACLLKTSLLTLNDACVTGQVASLLQCGAVVLAVDLVQCTSDTQAQSTCLAGGATTVDACDDVVCALKLEELEGLVDVLLAIPSLLLSLTVIILLGFGTLNAAVAVGVAAIASFARLARAEVVRVRHSDYVEAAFGSGGTFFAVFWRHILPNSLTAVLAFATLQFGQAILALSTLSFLGYGTPPPVPEWGLLIAEGRNYLSTAWWLTTFPGVAVVAVVLAANRISRQFSGERS